MKAKPSGTGLPDGTYEVRQYIRVDGGDISEIMEQRNVETGESCFSSSVTIVGPAGPLGTVSFPVPGETLDKAFVALAPTRVEIEGELRKQAASRIVVPTQRLPGQSGGLDGRG